MPTDEGSPIAIVRMGVDVPIEDEEDVDIQMKRIKVIEGLNPLKCKHLSLVACVIDSMAGIEDCNLLETLDLGQNQITHITNLEGKTRLRELDLSFNHIEGITNLQDCAKTLIRLRLQNNRIREIPESLLMLDKLIELELGSNKIQEIKNIPSNDTLEELWLGRNRIRKMKLEQKPDYTLLPYKNTRILSLQNNLIQGFEVEDEFLQYFPNLSELYISENFITDPIPSYFPRLLKQLTLLDASNNKMKSVGAIPEMTGLTELWLNNNNIEDLDEIKKLGTLTKLETIYLEGNPFKANLGPAYRQTILDLFPNLKQLDAIYLGGVVLV